MLEAVHSPSGPARKVTIFKSLLNLKMIEDGSMAEHLNMFFDLFDKLTVMELKLQDELLTIMILSSLPKSYENYIIAMETRDALPSTKVLKAKLLEEGRSQNQRSQHHQQQQHQNQQQQQNRNAQNRQIRNKNLTIKDSSRDLPVVVHIFSPDIIYGAVFKCHKKKHYQQSDSTSKRMKGFSAFKEKASGVFNGFKPGFDNLQIAKSHHGGLGGYEEMEGTEGAAADGRPSYGAQSHEERPDSPLSFEEIERPPLRKIDQYCKAECPCLPARYTIAVMACIGFMIAFGMRCNMSAAKLKMEHNGTVFMNWTVAVESHVDSSFFWGYLVTQIPGGFIASKFPANKIFGLSIVSSATLHLIVPFSMTLLHGHVVICVRVLQGLFEGVTYPACHGIWRFWAPPMERSRLATLAFSGSYAGVVVGLPLSGLLADTIGYEAPFYAYGVFGITWYCFWLWLCFENPRKHPAISLPELKYIEKSLGETSVQPSMPSLKTTPWHAMMRSMPVYAIIVANFCRSWNFYLLVLFQSSFLKHKFGFKVEAAGFVGSLPHLIMTTIVPFGGMLADHLRKNGILSTTNVRKLFNCGGFGMEGLFFLFVAHSDTATGAMFALTCGVAFSGFAISGYNVNHLDIAPRYASILMGLSNGIGTLAGIIVPYALDGLIQRDPKGCWTTVFTLAACVHLIGCTFYGIFASGELQPWAEPISEEKQIWSPPEGVITQDPYQSQNYIKETSFGELKASEQNDIKQSNTINYGATGHVANNPFAVPSTAMPANNTLQPLQEDEFQSPQSVFRDNTQKYE